MKKTLQWMVLPVLMLTLALPQGAQAATYQTASQQQQIAYLYSLIAQLQLQLNALLVNGSSQSSYVSVETIAVDGDDNDSVELSGRINFRRDGDARVWFEYGSSMGLLSYSTPSYTIDNGRSGRSTDFSIIAPDLSSAKTYYYRAVAEGEDGRFAEGMIKSFRYDSNYQSNNSNNHNNNSNDDVPDATTDEVDNIDTDQAELNGQIDMNDYENGIAFFVYGEDEDMVDDVKDENRYNDIVTDGDNLRKILLTSNLDDDRSYSSTVYGLDDDTEHFFRICVEYDDEDDDETLVCGDVESFETDRN